MAEHPQMSDSGASEPRLLDRIRQSAFAKFGRPEPGVRYAEWVRRFVVFHGKRHPCELWEPDVQRIFAHVAKAEKDPLRSLEQAHEALRFLYDEVLGLERGEMAIPKPPKLMDRVRHYSPRTEDRYVEWSERYIRFHDLRHPREMGGAEIEMFLTDLAVKGHVSESTQNQALCALLFLYQEVRRRGGAGASGRGMWRKWLERLRRAAFCMQFWMGGMRDVG